MRKIKSKAIKPLSEEDKIEQQMLRAYRRNNFKVLCEPSRVSSIYGDDEYVLTATQNGTQWYSMSVLVEEIDSFIEALEMARMHYKVVRRKR